MRSDCSSYFHLLCAYLHGLDISIRIDTINKPKNTRQFGSIEVNLRCHEHDMSKQWLSE